MIGLLRVHIGNPGDLYKTRWSHWRSEECRFLNLISIFEVLTMDMFAKKAASTKECITPHKISLLLLICELCDRTRDEITTPFRKHRHALMLLVLNLMQVCR